MLIVCFFFSLKNSRKNVLKSAVNMYVLIVAVWKVLVSTVPHLKKREFCHHTTKEQIFSLYFLEVLTEEPVGEVVVVGTVSHSVHELE